MINLIYILSVIILICGFWYLSGRSVVCSTFAWLGLYSLYVLIPAFYVDVRAEELHAYGQNASDIKLMALIGLLGFVFGASIMNLRHLGMQSQYVRRWRSLFILDDLGGGFRQWAIIAGLVCLSFGMVLIVENAHLYRMALSGILDNVGSRRQDIRAGSGIYAIQFVYILPWLSAILFLMFKSGKERGRKKKVEIIFSAVFALFAFVGQAALLYRGNLVFTIIFFGIVAYSIRMANITKFVKPLCVALVIILVMTSWRVGGNNFGAVGDAIARRMTTPLVQLAYVKSQWPRSDWIAGQTMLMDFSALAPGYDATFNGEVYNETGNYGEGTATVTILGEGYANFGWLGIFLETGLLGMFFQWLHYWLFKGGKTTWRIFIYSLCTLYGAKTVIAGVGQVLPSAIVAFLELYMGIVLVSKLLPKRGRKISI